MGQNNKSTSSTFPWKEILGVLGVVLAAYIGYLGLRSQIEIPIQATQTAEAKLATEMQNTNNSNIIVVTVVITETPNAPAITSFPVTSTESRTPDQNNITIGGDINNSPFIVDNQGNVIINQNNPLPTPKTTVTLDVSDKITSGICVTKYDVISVRATGGITVGQFVGSVGPDGTDAGVLGFSLDDYDIFREFSHGALLCKLDTIEQWRECNSSADFQASSDGCLQFDVNDKEKSNNSGSFEVKVDVFAK